MSKTKSEVQKQTNIVAMVWFIAFFITAIALAFIMMGRSVDVSCSFNGIQYVKLNENAHCWNEEFSDDYCPLPTDISCSGRIPMLTVNSIARNLG